MTRFARYGTATRAAFVGLVAAGVLLAVSLGRALTVDPLPAGGVEASELAWTDSHRPGARAPVDISAVLDHDSFHPERRRPARRYRLPSARTASAPAPAASSLGSIELIGTTVYERGGGSAVIRESGGLVRTLRIGDQLNDFTLQRVDRGVAVFVAPGGVTVSIEAKKPGG